MRKHYLINLLIFVLSTTLCACQTTPQQNLIQTKVRTILQYPNPKQASAAMLKLRNLYPNQALISSALAYLYEQQYQLQAAAESYQYAIDLEPQNAVWHNNLGIFLCKQHHFLKALPVLKKARTLATKQDEAMIQDNINKCTNMAQDQTPKTLVNSGKEVNPL